MNMPTLILLLCICFLSIGLLYKAEVVVRLDADIRKLQGGAVQRGYAKWTPNEKTGDPIFSWKEPEKLP